VEECRPKVSIIIVTYNNETIIGSCLDSICEATASCKYEVVIVDNASSDNTVQVVRDHPIVSRLIVNTCNEGYAKANNKGMQAAEGDYYLLLNSDAWISKGMLEAMVELLESDIAIAAVGPQILNADGSLQSQGWLFPSIGRSVAALVGMKYWHRVQRGQEGGRREYWSPHAIRQVGWVSGCCIMLRKGAFIALGGLCEEFKFYGEDYEWCYRAKKRGRKIVYCGTVTARHLNGGSSKDQPKKALFLEADLLAWKLTRGRFQGVIILGLDLIGLQVKRLAYLIWGRRRGDRGTLHERVSWQSTRLRQLLQGRVGSYRKDGK
jgi:GT2 family glycosyltransferase